MLFEKGAMLTGEQTYPARTLDCVAQGRRRAFKAYLVEVQPGVHVVEDYYRPVFFAHRCFWRFRDGGWVRSGSWLGPWHEASARDIPAELSALPEPDRYALFRGPRNATRHPIPESGA